MKIILFFLELIHELRVVFITLRDFSNDLEAKIYSDWTTYIICLRDLHKQISKSDWKPDHLVCVSRGGLTGGAWLSYQFDDLPLSIIAAESYPKDRANPELKISRHMCFPTETIAGKVLLFDDLTEKGRTLIRSIEYLNKKFGGQITEIRTAAVFHKEWSDIEPNFFAVKLFKDKQGKIPWIKHPWEK